MADYEFGYNSSADPNGVHQNDIGWAPNYLTYNATAQQWEYQEIGASLPGQGDTVYSLAGDQGSVSVGTVESNPVDGQGFGAQIYGSAELTANNAENGVLASGGGSITINDTLDGSASADTGGTVNAGVINGGAATETGGTITGGTINGGVTADGGDITATAIIDGLTSDDTLASVNVGSGGTVQAGSIETVGDDSVIDEVDGGSLIVTNYATTSSVESNLEIIDGGSATITNLAADNISVTISGTGSTLDYGGTLMLGDSGTGSLSVEDATQGFAAVILGEQTEGDGDLGVSGTVTITGSLTLSVAGRSGVTVGDGSLTVDGVIATATQAGSSGQISITQDGTLDADDGITFGPGKTYVLMTGPEAVLNTGPANLQLDQGFVAISLYGGATFNAAAGTITFEGTPSGAKLPYSSFAVFGTNLDGTASAASSVSSKTLTVGGLGNGVFSAQNGGVVTVSGALNIGTIAVSGLKGVAAAGPYVEVMGAGAKISAQTATIGGAVPAVDNDSGQPNGTDGDWAYNGTSGVLSISGQGAATITGRTTLAQGFIEFATGGSMEIGGNKGVAAGVLQIDAGGLLIGNGSVTSDSTGTIPIGATAQIPAYNLTITDNGTIEANDGGLTLDGDIRGSGVLKVDNNSSLELGGFVAAGITVDMAGSDPPSLILDDPSDFHGTITGLDVGDQIILRNTNLANNNAVVYATIGDLNGVQTLEIAEGTDFDHTITFPDGSTLINIPVQGVNGAPIPTTTNPANGTTAEFFNVTQSANGQDTVLTLQQGNPIDLAVDGPAARSAYGVDGAGITIGVISDSFDSLGGENDDIADGALPANVDVLNNGVGSDEGRAMAQLIHDIAPDANVDFYTAGASPAAMAQGVTALQDAGADVIVDDIAFTGPFPAEPNVGGALNDAIDDAVAAGVTYVTVAANEREFGVPIYGHDQNPLALTAAAMNYLASPSTVGGYLTAETEPFSSIGVTNGKPDITGPDGGPTTFALGAGLNPFFGTSAAAPVVAAVAALMLQENPQLEDDPLLVDHLLEDSAAPFGDPADEMGAGLVQADQAVAAAAAAETLLTGSSSTTAPVVKSILFAPASGDVATGAKVEIVLIMSEAVTVSGGLPTLTLNDGGVATYDAEESTPGFGRLAFDATVGSGDHTPSLEVTRFNPNGASVLGSGGVNADFSAALDLSSGVSVNSPLKATSVSVSQSGEAQAGQAVDITLTLNGAVTINTAGGSPTLTLSNGASADYDSAASNAAAGKLAFDYTVAAGDSPTPNLSIVAVNLPTGATVRNSAGDNADFSDALDRDTGLQIGAAFVNDVTLSQTSPASAGQTVQITLVVSDPVIIDVAGGSPSLTLNDGETATYDAAASDAAAGALAFDYTVESKDQTADLEITKFNPNGATVEDEHGVGVDFSAVVDFETGLTINSPLTVKSLTASQDGQSAKFTLTMSESFTVDAVDGEKPTLSMSDGTTATYDAVNSNPSAGALVFDDTLAPDEQAPVLQIEAVNLNGVAIQDAKGNNADFSSAILSFPDDVSALAYSSAYETIFVASASGGALEIFNTAENKIVDTLELSGDYSDGLFTLAKDAVGGTLISFAAHPYLAAAPGDVIVANLSGRAYPAYEEIYSEGTFLGIDYLFTPTGSAFSAYEYDYSAGNAFIGSQFYYTGITGKAYTGEEADYDGAGRLTRAAFTGVTGAAYSAYQYDYVGGVFSGSQFTFTTVPAGASYSSYQTDYNQAGQFAGEKFFFTNIQGQSYTGEEEDFDGHGALASVLLTGLADQAYSSLKLEYSAGAYEGYQAFYTGVTGQPYADKEIDVSAAGQIAKAVYSGMTSTPYSSVEQDYSSGALADVIYSFTHVTGAGYYAYQVEDNASGGGLQETLDLNGGGHDLIALRSGQTLTGLGDDTMTGNGATTFVLDAVYGADAIANLTSSDIVSMPDSEFASFTAISHAASFATGGAVIKAADGDTLTLKGVTTSAQLQALSGDFTFHA